MLYNSIPQTQTVTIPDPVNATSTVFSSDRGSAAGSFRVPLGVRPALMDRSKAGMALTNAQPAFHIINLISCAAAVYIYTGASGVRSVAVFHAHTGDIPPDEGPMASKYNVHGVPASDVYVVFASSQEMKANPREGIQTAGQGLFQILADGVPQANIRVLTGTGTFGANLEGDCGTRYVQYWPNGNLRTVCATAVANGALDYRAQFPGTTTKIGFAGTGHNLTEANTRIQALTQAVSNATNDSGVLDALSNFFQGAHSFKAGSLKLFMTQRLCNAIRGTTIATITPTNAQNLATDLIQGIRAGRY
jgi:hypothetical protein